MFYFYCVPVLLDRLNTPNGSAAGPDEPDSQDSDIPQASGAEGGVRYRQKSTSGATAAAEENAVEVKYTPDQLKLVKK